MIGAQSRHLPESLFCIVVTPQFQQCVAQQLVGRALVALQFDQAPGVITRGLEVVRCEFHLREFQKARGIAFGGHGRKRGLRPLRGERQEGEVARFPDTLQVIAGQFVARDEIVRVAPDPALQKTDGLLQHSGVGGQQRGLRQRRQRRPYRGGGEGAGTKDQRQQPKRNRRAVPCMRPRLNSACAA